MSKKVRGVFEHPKGSGIWWCQYFANGQRHREKVGPKSAAGDLYRKRKTEARMTIKFPELRRQQVTLGALIDLAIAYAKEHNRSAADYVGKGELLRADLGKRNAETLTQDELADWIRARGVAPATFNRYRSFLSLCYREGMARGKVTRNVASLIRQKREPSGRQRYLTRQEYARVLKSLSERVPPDTLAGPELKAWLTARTEQVDAFTVSIWTGLRQAEQFRLRWRDVDFERGEILLSETKNGSEGIVPMNSLVAETLRARKKAVPSRRSDLVFPIIGSQKFLDVRPWFPDALTDAKVEGYTWHGNRHTFCSWLAIGGSTLKTIQELARHKMITMTARYAHLSPDHKRAEIERLLDPPNTPKVLPFSSATKTATSANAATTDVDTMRAKSA